MLVLSLIHHERCGGCSSSSSVWGAIIIAGGGRNKKHAPSSWADCNASCWRCLDLMSEKCWYAARLFGGFSSRTSCIVRIIVEETGTPASIDHSRRKSHLGSVLFAHKKQHLLKGVSLGKKEEMKQYDRIPRSIIAKEEIVKCLHCRSIIITSGYWFENGSGRPVFHNTKRTTMRCEGAESHRVVGER